MQQHNLKIRNNALLIERSSSFITSTARKERKKRERRRERDRERM
jgi:hypothetical protein